MKYDFAPQLTTEHDVRNFTPGERLRGLARWLDPIPTQSVELRLFHYTEGKGTQDVDVVHTLPLDAPGPFEFQLPRGPCSFSGRLVSLAWALELVITPGNQVAPVDLVLSPTAEEIDLTRFALPEEIKKIAKSKFEFARNR